MSHSGKNNVDEQIRHNQSVFLDSKTLLRAEFVLASFSAIFSLISLNLASVRAWISGEGCNGPTCLYFFNSAYALSYGIFERFALRNARSLRRSSRESTKVGEDGFCPSKDIGCLRLS